MPTWNERFAFALRWAISIRSGSGSIPSTLPVGPTRPATCSASSPVPLPMSSTCSPARTPSSAISRWPWRNCRSALRTS
ncbi:hypothetical protein BE15_39970 [Sorangium cellulosum]|uniref:Uncharacterized protein n=1 Tax=Sorangium cellulosum TaxID=56 RepID=A0A150QAY7_SORCE|nr:hypothetical protein BE15_39970 [Sorangium cellulosum]